MTHKELLADIDLCIAHESEFGLKSIATAWKALRAVVELHKPKAHLSDNDLWCEGCYPRETAYPCPTIQAIEKELK